MSIQTQEEKFSKPIKDYDFRKPKKFTKEHLRDLNTVNENISRVLASNLSGILRVFCEVNFDEIEEQRYGDYVNQLPDKTFIGIMRLKPLVNGVDESLLIMHIPSKINFFMIDILLGGSGDGYELARAYTELETEILQNIYTKIGGFVSEAWNALLPVKYDMSGFETNPQLAQALYPGDTVITLTFTVKMRDITDTISLCIPAMNLDEILNSSNQGGKFNKTVQKTDNDKERVRRDNIYSALSQSELELKAVMCTLQLDTQDVVSLQPGDLIPLGKKIDSDIFITVGGIPWFTGKLGELKIKKAVKLCGLISPNDISRKENI